MTLTFISNYINHHQIPFCNACRDELGEGFHFIQTQPMEQERIDMGWHTDGAELPYVHLLYEEEDVCRKLIMESDVLLAGWTDREDLIGERLQAEKLTIRMSERIYREGQWKMISPRGLIQKYKDHIRYRKNQVYLLCAGAYVSSDFHLIKAYPGKMYKWGYFPETIYYDEEEWANLKAESDLFQIVWAGRFIPLKHPEQMILLAKKLKEEKELWEREENPFTDFCIHMVGSGEMEASLKEMAKKNGVEEHVRFYGFLSPEEVRAVMEKSHVHVFTSNHLEGWGAVVNEAMNSGCVEVANVQVGAAPYLIKHGENGLVYPDGNPDKMIEAVISLIREPDRRREMSRAAYETIVTKWNAGQAAKRLIHFVKKLLNGKVERFEDGPLSPAPVIAPSRMYIQMIGNGIK